MTFSSPPLTHKKHNTLNVSHPSAAQVFCNNSTGSPHMFLALECDLPKLEAANGGSWTRNGLPDTTPPPFRETGQQGYLLANLWHIIYRLPSGVGEIEGNEYLNSCISPGSPCCIRARPVKPTASSLPRPASVVLTLFTILGLNTIVPYLLLSKYHHFTTLYQQFLQQGHRQQQQHKIHQTSTKTKVLFIDSDDLSFSAVWLTFHSCSLTCSWTLSTLWFANRISSSWVVIPFTGISNLISPKVSVSTVTSQQSGVKFKGWIALLPVLLTESTVSAVIIFFHIVYNPTGMSVPITFNFNIGGFLTLA